MEYTGEPSVQARVAIGKICQFGNNVEQLKPLIRGLWYTILPDRQMEKWVRMAAWNGHPHVLRSLYQNVTRPMRSELSHKRLHNPIITAAQYGHYQCVEFLLESMRTIRNGKFYSNYTLVELLLIACQDGSPQLVSIVLGHCSVLLHLQHAAYNVWDNIDDHVEATTIREWLLDPPDEDSLCGRGDSGLEELNHVWDAQKAFTKNIEKFDPVCVDGLTKFFKKFNELTTVRQNYIDPNTY